MQHTPCPATRDLVYFITHDHPFCHCFASDKNLRCKFFERFIDGSTPPGSPRPTENWVLYCRNHTQN